MPADETAEVVLPALLRAARGAYRHAIARSLAEAGFDDLPRNGAFVLGAMANHGGAAPDVVAGLGVSKQAASQLIDTLVLRGYLEREANQVDRRRMDLHPTERGVAAARAVRRGVLDVDADLAARISPDELAALRAGLQALADISFERRTRSGP